MRVRVPLRKAGDGSPLISQRLRLSAVKALMFIVE